MALIAQIGHAVLDGGLQSPPLVEGTRTFVR